MGGNLKFQVQDSFLEYFFLVCFIFGCANDQKLISISTWYISGKKKRDTGYGYHVQEECGTIEDCFDQPCPRFGAVVKVTFTRRIPSYVSGYRLTERQTGEGFKSAAPPDCRVTVGAVASGGAGGTEAPPVLGEGGTEGAIAIEGAGGSATPQNNLDNYLPPHF